MLSMFKLSLGSSMIRVLTGVLVSSLLSFQVFARSEAPSTIGTKPSACVKSTQALYDVGSGATKLTVLEASTCPEVPKILLKASEKVDYKEDILKSPQKVFSEQVLKAGIESLKRLKKQADRFKPISHRGIATAAFREAQNTQTYIQKIKEELEISLEVVSQEREAHLAFGAVAFQTPEKSLLVWDIGGGSFQFIAKDVKTQQFQIVKGDLASVSFKDYVIKNIKKNSELTSPNPLTKNELNEARSYVQSYLKRLLQNSFIPKYNFKKVAGIGGVHYLSISKYLKKTKYSAKDIDAWLEQNHGLTDAELKDEYSATAITNMILVSEIMKLLKISEIEALESSLVEGLLNEGSLRRN